jgi:hypothetical protein
MSSEGKKIITGIQGIQEIQGDPPRDENISKGEKTLIHIPKDGNCIEILGHKIDGYASFEAFLRQLEKYAHVEEENQKLLARLRHLLQSETVRLFDEVNPRTQKYMRNIRRLDTYGLQYKILEYERAAETINANRLIHRLTQWKENIDYHHKDPAVEEETLELVIDLIRQEAAK